MSADDDSDHPSGWEKLAGTSARSRIIEAILSHPSERDVALPKLAEYADVHRSTMYEHIDDLVDLGVLEQTREIGNTPLYRLDTDNEVTRALIELDGAANRAGPHWNGDGDGDGGDES